MCDNYETLPGTKCGHAIRFGSPVPTSDLLASIGVDCTIGVTKRLVDQRMQLKDLPLTFIILMPSDHYFELGSFLHTAWTAGLITPVEIFDPAGLNAYWNGFLASMKVDIDLWIEDEGCPDLRSLVTIHPIDSGEVYACGVLTISATCIEHSPLVNCFALSLRTGQHYVVFSGDRAPITALEDFTRGADLRVHEAMLNSALPVLMASIGNGSEEMMKQRQHSHIFAHDAARAATDADVQHLAFLRLIPSDDPTHGPQDLHDTVAGHWVGPQIVGHDSIRVEL